MTQRRRLLVIDDSATIRKLVELSFASTEWSAEFAVNGRDAIARVQRQLPDAVLLDFVLSDMKGPDVCRALRSLPHIDRVAIVVMSGKPESIRSEFLEFPFVVGFVGKPFSAADVVAGVREAVRRRADAPSEAADPAPPDAPGVFSGRLGTVAIPSLMRAIAQNNRQGTLRLSAGALTLSVYLTEGAWCLAETHPPRRAILVKCGLQISDEDWRRAEGEQLSSGRPALLTLAEQGELGQASLSALFGQQSREVLLDAVKSRLFKSFAFFPEEKLPLQLRALASPLHLSSLELAVLRAAKDVSAVQGLLQRADTAVFRRAPGFSRRVAAFELDELERTLLANAGRDVQLSPLAARLKFPLEAVAAALSRLCAVGLLAEGVLSPAEKKRGIAILAEDQSGFGESLRHFLRSRGTVTWFVPDRAPAAALEFLRLEKPEVLIVSAQEEAALATASTVKADPALRDLRLVAVMDSPWSSAESKLTLAGYEAILTKPVPEFEFEQLLSMEQTTREVENLWQQS